MNFHEGVQPESGVKVLITTANLEEVDLILAPSKIKEGTYKIEIIRKGSSIYKLEGTKYYIETK